MRNNLECYLLFLLLGLLLNDVFNLLRRLCIHQVTDFKLPLSVKLSFLLKLPVFHLHFKVPSDQLLLLEFSASSRIDDFKRFFWAVVRLGVLSVSGGSFTLIVLVSFNLVHQVVEVLSVVGSHVVFLAFV